MRAVAFFFIVALMLGSGTACVGGAAVNDNRRLSDWHIERPLALYILKHAELARQKISELNAAGTVKASKAAAAIAQEVDADIRRDLLEPIYDRYPDLRGKDVRAAEVAPFKTLGPMDAATAQRIDQAVERADAHWRDLSNALKAVSPTLAGVQLLWDISSEIGFITAPGEQQYPALFEARMARLKPPADPRTPNSDATMRERAVPLRDIKLTAAARAAIVEFAAELRRYGDEVLAVSWDLGGASKGPDDKEWKKAPPGLGIGGYERSQLPPDMIGTLDGIAIVFLDDKPSRMRGKTIDYADRHFRLRD